MIRHVELRAEMTIRFLVRRTRARWETSSIERINAHDFATRASGRLTQRRTSEHAVVRHAITPLLPHTVARRQAKMRRAALSSGPFPGSLRDDQKTIAVRTRLPRRTVEPLAFARSVIVCVPGERVRITEIGTFTHDPLALV